MITPVRYFPVMAGAGRHPRLWLKGVDTGIRQHDGVIVG